MNKKILLLVILVVGISIVSAWYYYVSLLPHYAPPKMISIPSNQQSGTYLRNHGGFEYHLFLVDSQFYYGAYEQNFTPVEGPQGEYLIQPGDPCIIINGTIRNDYAGYYYFSLGMDVWNADGDKVEPITTQSGPIAGFTSVIIAEKDITGVFELRMPYNATDITAYELVVLYHYQKLFP